jgi:Holliday junction resolvasome RuvABC DNA-binding subunit
MKLERWIAERKQAKATKKAARHFRRTGDLSALQALGFTPEMIARHFGKQTEATR